MAKGSIRRKANGILVLSGVGILAAFPFQHHFAGGLLFAGFSAATIGGLADSFAISALFGDPLRIKWPGWMGTRIIARRREKLIGELADMVEKELLTVDHIRETLRDYNLGDAISRYLTDHGGAGHAQSIAKKLAAEMLGKADAGQLADGMSRFLRDHADALRASDLLADIGEWSIKHGYDERILGYAAKQLAALAGGEPIRRLIEQFAESAVKSYEGDKFRRRLVDFTAGLNAYAISVKVQEWLVRFLEGMADAEHPARKTMKEQIADFVERLRSDEELRQEVERIKSKLLDAAGEHLNLEQFVAKRLEGAKKRLLAQTQSGAVAQGESVEREEGVMLGGAIEQGEVVEQGDTVAQNVADMQGEKIALDGAGEQDEEAVLGETVAPGEGVVLGEAVAPGEGVVLGEAVAPGETISQEKAVLQSEGEAEGWIGERIRLGVEQLSERPELRLALDVEIKQALLRWLEGHHALIGRLVREKLDAFTEEELSEFVKDKAGKDLQYIRLNGMIVGAFVGIALYLATFWIGGARG